MAAFIHEKSCHCALNQLDLFSLKPTQISVEDSGFTEFLPVATLTSEGPIEFHIPASDSHYVDLSSTLLHVNAKIVNADGTNLVDDAEVAPVNYFLHALWNQIDLVLNQKTITQSSNGYAYRAIIEALMNFNSETKRTQLSSGMFFQDSANKHNTIGNQNKGFQARKEASANSSEMDMCGALHLDMMFQERYLLNHVDVKLRFTRTKDTFCIMAAENSSYKVVLNHVSLFVRRVKLSSPILLGHTKALQLGTSKYPITRSEIRVLNIAQGSGSLNQEAVIHGRLPQRMVIGLVGNENFNGAYHKNPFRFHHYGINNIALYRDGNQVGSKNLKPNFGQNQFVRSFFTLLRETGIYFSNSTNGLTQNDFKGGTALFCFDLSADRKSDSNFELIKHGNIRLEITFAQPLTESVNVIIYSEYENLIEIDKRRNIFFGYA